MELVWFLIMAIPALFFAMHMLIFWAALMVYIIFNVYHQFSKLPQEEGKTPLYERKFCWGGTHFLEKVSYTRLAIYDSFVVIANMRPFIIPKTAITQVSAKTGFPNSLTILYELPHRSSPCTLYAMGNLQEAASLLSPKTP